MAVSALPQARAELNRIESTRPDAISLAMLASLARHVEPELLRALRLRCATHFQGDERPRVDTEAAVWFGPFVETRGPDGITFYPEYAELLRQRLRKTPELFELAHAVIDECHLSIAPVVRWEEELVYAALAHGMPETQRRGALERAAWRGLKAISGGQRPGLEEWVVDMWERLPEPARHNPVVGQMRAVSEARVRLREGGGEGVKPGTAGWPEVVLDVERLDHGLRLGFLNGQGEFGMPVPDIEPVTIEVLRKKPEVLIVPRGGFVDVENAEWPLRLRTLDGRVYEIEQKRIAAKAARFVFDVFLSHVASDKARVRRLAERLRDKGLRVWFDEWVIRPGDDIHLAIERGLENARTLVLCLSPAALLSDWVFLERGTVRFRDPANVDRRFIPLLLEECDLPGALRMYRHVDFREEDDEAFAELLAACRPVIPEPRPAHVKEPLRGHSGQVRAVAATSDGRRLISGAYDRTVRAWDLGTDACIRVLRGHADRVLCVATSSDGRRAASGSADGTIRVWDLSSGDSLALDGHESDVFAVVFTPDGRSCLSGSFDRTVRIWDLESSRCTGVLEGHEDSVFSLAVTPDGKRAASSSGDGTIHIWDLQSLRSLGILRGHEQAVDRLAITPDGYRVTSISRDHTVRLWDVARAQCLRLFEGHAAPVLGLCQTPDGRYAATTALDRTLRIWDLESGACVATKEVTGVLSLAMAPDGARLFGGCSDGNIVQWDFAELLRTNAGEVASTYVSAKVVLLGDSGVGKSGLARRLADDQFAATASTHGVAVWRLDARDWAQIPPAEEREVLLWDLAGQEDYRLLHRLRIDDAAMALVLINPRSDDPLAGAEDWVRALGSDVVRILVAARSDIGGLRVGRQKIDRFLEEHGFAGYLETSAKTGENCLALKQLIAERIPWNRLERTTAPKLLTDIRKAVLEMRDEGEIRLLRFTELCQQLGQKLGVGLNPEMVRTAVTHLGHNGLLLPLPFGDLVLMQPELLDSYAGAVIRSARQHVDEIGWLREEDVFERRLDFSGVRRLNAPEEALLMRALVQMFLDRSLCLSDDTPQGRLLIFPSLYRRERPFPNEPEISISYSFRGDLQAIFSTLVVRLAQTQNFVRKELWRNAAEFLTLKGQTAGLVVDRIGDREGRIHVFFDREVPDAEKALFAEYVHRHIAKYAQDVRRERRYFCRYCGAKVDSALVERRLAAGRDFVTCMECDRKIPLQDFIEERAGRDPVAERVLAMEEASRRELDAGALEQMLIGHMMAVCEEANQIFRTVTGPVAGIDGEVEFRNDDGMASGRRIYLELRSRKLPLPIRESDGRAVFDITTQQARLWVEQPEDVYLVIRDAEETVRWMNVTRYLKEHGERSIREVVFEGEKVDAATVWRLRDAVFGRDSR